MYVIPLSLAQELKVFVTKHSKIGDEKDKSKLATFKKEAKTLTDKLYQATK